MEDRIVLEPGNAAWAQTFVQLAGELATHLGPAAQIEHVGSTAVAGLAAKPVLDVLVGVPDKRSLADANSGLVIAGFKMGSADADKLGSAFFSRLGGSGDPAVNVHLTIIGSRQWTDLIRFRDRLRADSALRGRYQKLKFELAASSRGDLDAYTAGKASFVNEVLGAGDE